ncbi:hypothetical protein AB836_01915 [Rickettsiales bacterium (ex Bugula neritina AB1)]|nr:hypothetical protein AB836_01915 [Rickettsiales bacterium (ex Bugula neritina AB1)]
MSKTDVDIEENKKVFVNVGTVGHVDHGKSTLTAAIKNISDAIYKNKDQEKKTLIGLDNIDKTREEKERGITINSTCIEYHTKHRVLGHVDCPGHADYVKNMITGAANIQIAILLVSAGDGVQPQTLEHIKLLNNLGVSQVIIVINKCDLYGLDNAEVAKMEVDEVLEKYGYNDCPYVFCSATEALKESSTGNYTDLGGKAIISLLEIIDTLPIKNIEERKLLPFCATVEEVIPIFVGSGENKKVQFYVVTTRVKNGTLKVGDVIPFIDRKGVKKKATVFSIEKFRVKVSEADPDDNIGIVLKGVKPEDLSRGVVLGEIKLSNKFKGTFYLYEDVRKNPVGVGYRPHGYSGVTASAVTIKNIIECPRLEEKLIYPGDIAVIELESDKLIPVNPIILRDGKQTIGVFKPNEDNN